MTIFRVKLSTVVVTYDVHELWKIKSKSLGLSQVDHVRLVLVKEGLQIKNISLQSFNVPGEDIQDKFRVRNYWSINSKC